MARLDHGFARVGRGAQHVEFAALAFVEDGDDAASHQLVLAPGEQLAGRLVGHADHAVGRGHEHRVGHAAEHVGQVILVDGGLAQLLAHALERRLQLAELVAPADFQRPRVVAVRDAIRALDERADGLVHAPARPPGEDEADQQCHGAERAGDRQVPCAPGRARWNRNACVPRRCRGTLRANGSSISTSPTVRGVSMPGRVCTLARMGVIALRVMAPARSPLAPPGVQLAPGQVAHLDAEQRAVVLESFRLRCDRAAIATAARPGSSVPRCGATFPRHAG